MTCRPLVWTAVVGIALTARVAQPIPLSAHLRSADEVRKLMGTEGYTSYGTTTGHVDFIAYFAPNGTVETRAGAMTDHVQNGIPINGLHWQNRRVCSAPS